MKSRKNDRNARRESEHQDEEHELEPNSTAMPHLEVTNLRVLLSSTVPNNKIFSVRGDFILRQQISFSSDGNV